MAKIIYQNAQIVALNEEKITMQSGTERRKLTIQLTENTRDGVIIAGGIEAWDDTINNLKLKQGDYLSELHCRVTSRFSNGRWWWSVQAYKAVHADELNLKQEEQTTNTQEAANEPF